MIRRERSAEDWLLLESRAIAFIVRSRFHEEDLLELFKAGLTAECFTIPEHKTIVAEISAAMLEGHHSIYGIYKAAQAVPRHFWEGILNADNDINRELVFPKPSDIRPLLTRAAFSTK